MDIFSEFESLKKEYNDLMNNRFNDAPFSETFECIFDVIEYIYDGEKNGEEVSDDLLDLFSFGFRYLNEKFLYIKTLIEKTYKTDNEFKKHYSEIDMLFYIMDFITDAKLEDLDASELMNLQDEVFSDIENKKPLKEDVGKRLEAITNKTFMKGFHGFLETFEVLYDAITFGTDEEKDDGEFYDIDK